ncbi:MAG: hypothetical protein ACK5NC_11230 [Vibrio sp.]
MALLQCFECGAKVSSEADKCPKCGGPAPTSTAGITISDADYRKLPKAEQKAFKKNGGKVAINKTRLVLVLFFLFIIFVMLSGGA